MTDPTSCCDAAGNYCSRCDLLVGLDGFHVIDVTEDDGQLTVTIESAPTVMGCTVCGVVAHGHGRTVAELVDAADEDDLRHVIEEAADVHNFLVALVHQAIARYRGRKKNEN